MKCVNCNGEVDSQAIKCPYCGSRNEAGIEFNKQVYEKIKRNRLLAPFLLRQQTPELIQKLLTRMIWAMLGASLALMVFSIGLIVYSGQRTEETPRPDSYAEVYEKVDTFENSYYFSFINTVNLVIDAWDTGSTIRDYTVDTMVDYTYLVIHGQEQIEPMYWERAMLEIEMVYQDMLGLTDEEMLLFQEKDSKFQYSAVLPDSVREQISELVCEKLGNLVEE